MPLGTIYLIRHGETEWNLAGRRQGHLDSRLTERGRAQAGAAGRRLRGLVDPSKLSLLTSSPLGRARETARRIAEELGVDPVTVRPDPRLAEHHMGEWQGLTSAEVDERFPGAREQRAIDKWEYVIPGGESYARLEERARAWLDAVSDHAVVAAVAHEMINRTLLGAYCGRTREETLALSHPHGVIFRLAGGEMEEVG